MSNIIQVTSSGGLASSPYFWAVAAVLAAVLISNILRPPAQLKRDGSPVKPYKSSLLPGLGPIALFEKRNSFLRSVFGDPEEWNSTPPKQKSMRVNVRGHIMTITNDPKTDGKTFFNDRGLDFNNAYEVMFAGVPEMPSWLRKKKTPATPDEGDAAIFIQNLKPAISSKRLQQNLPDMVRHATDLFKSMQKQGGQIDVHESIYPLIFQISVLFVGLAEHARDINAVRRMEGPFWTFADNTGFMPTIFPLIPALSTLKKWWGAVKMSAEIRQTIEKRKKDNRQEEDYIQEMINRDTPVEQIEAFIMGGLFAAIINTTGVASYFLIFVCSDPVARDRVREEFESIFRKSAKERGDDYDKLTIQEKMERTPLEMWENDLPYYESVLDETLRILMISLIFRRKLHTPGSKVTNTTSVISGDTIQDKEFIAFWLGSAHRNSNIYSNPLSFDPSRFERGEGKGEGEFVPWGAGRHVCLGMRFAKLEVRAVHAAFLLSFPDVRSVDQNGDAYDSTSVPFPEQESEHRRYPERPVKLAYSANLLATEAA